MVPEKLRMFLYVDHSTYLEPDLIVVCDRDKLKPDGCYGAPDWVVEILSPSSLILEQLFVAVQVSDCWCQRILDRRSHE